MRHRGLAYPFPLAYFVLDVFNDSAHECFLLVWNQQRVDSGVPSIFG